MAGMTGERCDWAVRLMSAIVAALPSTCQRRDSTVSAADKRRHKTKHDRLGGIRPASPIHVDEFAQDEVVEFATRVLVLPDIHRGARVVIPGALRFERRMN